MKKVARILGLACMIGMVAFTSCKKEDEKVMTISVSTPEMTVDDADRAYIQPNYQFMWEKGDVIKVYNLDADPANSLSRIFHNISGGPRPRANFQGPSVGAAGSEGYRFFYPETMAVGDDDLLTTNNHERFEVLPEQNYGFYETANHPKMIVDPASMPMAVRPAKLTSSTNMKHMFGVAKLGFLVDQNVDKTVEKIVLTDNVYNLNGHVELNVAAVNMAELEDLMAEFKANDANFFNHYQQYVMGDMEWSPEGDGDNTMTLYCDYPGADGVTLNDSNSEWFYIMLRPLALAQGFQVKLYFTDGTILNINEYWNHEMRDKAMEPGKIKTLTYDWPIYDGDMYGATWE